MLSMFFFFLGKADTLMHGDYLERKLVLSESLRTSRNIKSASVSRHSRGYVSK